MSKNDLAYFMEIRWQILFKQGATFLLEIGANVCVRFLAPVENLTEYSLIFLDIFK